MFKKLEQDTSKMSEEKAKVGINSVRILKDNVLEQK